MRSTTLASGAGQGHIDRLLSEPSVLFSFQEERSFSLEILLHGFLDPVQLDSCFSPPIRRERFQIREKLRERAFPPEIADPYRFQLLDRYRGIDFGERFLVKSLSVSFHGILEERILSRMTFFETGSPRVNPMRDFHPAFDSLSTGMLFSVALPPMALFG
jgi:hypothetical protein